MTSIKVLIVNLKYRKKLFKDVFFMTSLFQKQINQLFITVSINKSWIFLTSFWPFSVVSRLFLTMNSHDSKECQRFHRREWIVLVKNPNNQTVNSKQSSERQLDAWAKCTPSVFFFFFFFLIRAYENVVIFLRVSPMLEQIQPCNKLG